MKKDYLCTACGRRFTTGRGGNAHCTDKHEGGGVILFKPKQRSPKPGPGQGDDEPSYADRAVEAEWDRAAGIPNDDIEWLLPK